MQNAECRRISSRPIHLWFVFRSKSEKRTTRERYSTAAHAQFAQRAADFLFSILGSGMMQADPRMLWGRAILSEASATSAERNDADALLVVRIRAGDEDAFELLMARYQAPLFRYLRG